MHAARWTTRWFNKPKFHILLHLPQHVRRFGPAILFATEGFESFNAVIRAKSVHSNRQAPSRDIAHAFAQGSRIRHFLSGGLITQHAKHPDVQINESSTHSLSPSTHDASTAGPGPLAIVARPNIITDYLGLKFPDETRGRQLPNPDYIY